MKDKFNLDDFLKSLTDPDAMDKAFKDMIMDEFGSVMAVLAPKIWALAIREAMKDPTNPARLNAILNAVTTSSALFLVAMTPDGMENDLQEEAIRKISTNIREAYKNPELVKDSVRKAAHGLGMTLLLDDVNSETTKAMQDVAKALHHMTQVIGQLRD